MVLLSTIIDHHLKDNHRPVLVVLEMAAAVLVIKMEAVAASDKEDTKCNQ